MGRVIALSALECGVAVGDWTTLISNVPGGGTRRDDIARDRMYIYIYIGTWRRELDIFELRSCRRVCEGLGRFRSDGCAAYSKTRVVAGILRGLLICLHVNCRSNNT